MEKLLRLWQSGIEYDPRNQECDIAEKFFSRRNIHFSSHDKFLASMRVIRDKEGA